MGTAVPGVQELREIRLGDLSRKWDGELQLPESCRSRSFAGEHGLVAARGAFVEPASDTVRTVDRVSEKLFDRAMWKGLFAEKSDSLTEFWLLAYFEMSEMSPSSPSGSSMRSRMILAGIRTRPRSTFRGFLLREIDGCRRLAPVHDLHSLQPCNSWGAVGGAGEVHLVDDQDDAVVVRHEALGTRAQAYRGSLDSPCPSR